MSKYLIIGATGRSGVAIINSLLKVNENKITIVVRNVTKAREIFKNNYERLDKVEFEFGTNDNSSELEKAVFSADYIISAIGPTTKDNPLLSDYFSVKKMIEIAEKHHNLKKFIYVSSLLVTRPYHPFAFILNSIIPYVLGYKALAENLFRKSKIDYIIVRPGGLTDKEEINYVKIDQGDRMNGQISRATLAKFITDIINSQSSIKRTTIDVISEKRDYVFELPTLKEDNMEIDYITKDHFNATKNLTIIFYTILVIILIYLMNKFL